MNERKPYGSGYFGRWIEDEYGLPAYKYECNQILDPNAATPMNDLWRSKTDHYFLVGNDRVVGIASNYGYIKLRQDEGSPKYLNYYLPELQQYTGGFGYLTDGKQTLSTYYAEQNFLDERIYGVGYFRKKIDNETYSLDHVILAPFGDDPVLISQISITNSSDEKKNVSWFEYWSCFNFQFSFQAVLRALSKKDSDELKDYRVELEKKFKNKFIMLDGNLGLLNLKYDPSSRAVEEQKNFDLRKNGIQIGKKKPVYEDKSPHPIFLICLDDQVQGCFTDANKFFGKGGIRNPDGLKTEASYRTGYEGVDSCMVLKKDLELEPHETKKITFMYGYIPQGFQLNQLIAKYKTQKNSLLEKSLSSWKQHGPRFEIEGEDWVFRETLWHYYYLRGGLTYDDFFMEHILSQGHVYQYIIGFQGAARDPPQHAMPFLFDDADIVKQIIRYTFKETKKNGKIPYGITGNGAIMPSPWEPSDTELWLLWLTSEYVLSSKDKEFLDEDIPLYPIYKKNPSSLSIKEFLKIIFQHFTEDTGKGIHGLQKVESCDWNDMIITGFVPDDLLLAVKKEGESVLNSAMAAYVLPLFANLMDFVDEKDTAIKARIYANEMKNALEKQWNGKWFNRAWLTETLGWIGVENLWLEPQPWAIISDVVDEQKEARLVQSIDKMVRQPSKLGAILQSNPIESAQEPPGMATNAGIWASINGTLIWALTKANPEMAWHEWKKNTLTFHAETYPKIWYGIWSGPDTINSTFSEFPGHTLFNKYYLTGDPKHKSESAISMDVNWTDFPVLNLHPHAWPLFNITHLLGFNFTKEGLKVDLNFPKEIYEFSSKLCGLKKDQEGYSGWYNPKIKGEWIIELKLEQSEISQFKTLIVNNIEKELKIKENKIIFSGLNETEKGIYWQLKKW